jgi:hypothetical protein
MGHEPSPGQEVGRRLASAQVESTIKKALEAVGMLPGPNLDMMCTNIARKLEEAASGKKPDQKEHLRNVRKDLLTLSLAQVFGAAAGPIANLIVDLLDPPPDAQQGGSMAVLRPKGGPGLSGGTGAAIDVGEQKIKRRSLGAGN